MKKRKASVFLALLLAMAMLCSACSPSNSNTSQTPADASQDLNASADVSAGNQSDTLRIVIGAEPSNIMPLSAEAGDGQWIAWCIYDRLVDYDAETGELVPSLATSWEWIDDTHVRFFLRDDAVAYDGTTITANDVLFSVQRGLEGDATAQWSMVDGNECSVEDDYTFVLGLTEAYPSIIGKLAYVATLTVIDESSCEALGGYEAAVRNPQCTSGPYFFDEWKAGEYIRLVRNDNYWGEAGFYETLEFTWVNDSTSRTMAVASGDADFAVEIGSADLTAVESYDNCIGIMLGGGGTNVLFFNVTNEYLSNELVREAIFYAIDATACNMVGTNGTSLIADSVIASSVPYYKAPDGEYDRTVNLERARELLAEAGYADGFELFMPLVAQSQAVCEAIQASLLQIGITLRLETMEIPTYLAATDTGDYDLCFQPTFSDDIVNYVKYYDDRMELNTRGGGIVGAIEDMYSILDRCRYSTDEEDNMAAWGEFQDYIRDHYLTIPIYESSVFYCANGNYEYNNFSNGHINFATVRPAG